MKNKSLRLHPPIAKCEAKTLIDHGHERIDPYYWMRDRDNPEVIAYLEAENAYYEATVAESAELSETLYQEMISRIEETDSSVPVHNGEYFYYSRMEEGQPYPIYCRKRESLQASEQILLDLNRIASENSYDYLALGLYKISPNHNLLAYSLDTTGAERFTIHIQNLDTGEHVGTSIEDAYLDGEWADNTTFFYTTQDEQTERIDKLYRRIVGSKQADSDHLVYYEPDERYDVKLGITKDKHYLIMGPMDLATFDYWEVYFLATDRPLNEFQRLYQRVEGVHYSVEHREGRFYVVTNADGATSNKLITVPVDAPDRENWQTLVSHRQDVQLNQVDLFSDHLVRYERQNGLPTIQITSFSTGETHMLQFPDPVYTYGIVDNPNFDSTLLRYKYTPLLTPEVTLEYDMNSRQQVVKKEQHVYNPADYVTERIFAAAEDGSQIPISLAYRRDAWDGSPTALHLQAYGCYGDITETMDYTTLLSLLDRGVIIAIAHVRGGGMLGRTWYNDGKLLNKRNSFTDFIACAKHLIAQEYTALNCLTAEGYSAGGLLIGAAVNLAPDLFRAVIASMPPVDLLTTMLDESQLAATLHFDELGNPKDEETYWYMHSYSPYDQVTAQTYPHMLIETGWNDPMVSYREPAKWAAKLRALKTDSNVLLLHTQMNSGHAGSSDRYDQYKNQARQYAFILGCLGI